MNRLADIDATIALWQRPGPDRVSAFHVWVALGGEPWALVQWADVRHRMIAIAKEKFRAGSLTSV
jgi:hypothetical protein